MPLTKATFRKKCLQKLKNASKHNRLYKNSRVDSRLLGELQKSRFRKILFYTSLPFEADTSKSIRKLRKKYDVFVPFMQGESFKMVPFRLPLKKKNFGIYEAGNSLRNINKIDIAIVPVVGIDGNLQRVGFGKGMYDRFFEKLKKRPYTIFIQSEFCYTKKRICDPYDITCDLMITPFKQVRRKSGCREGYDAQRSASGRRCRRR